MGGLASAEAQRQQQAQLANQRAGLETQQLGEESLQNLRANQLRALGGQTGLYGTTPAMASLFGNQALQAYQQRAALDEMRNRLGLGLLGTQVQAYGSQPQTKPWWQTGLELGASFLSPFGGGQSGGNSGYQTPWSY